jgi:DNA mismatch repair protein MutS
MLRQYRDLKREQPGSILLFRMGDFYEMFYEDAKVASRLLELTLTARGKGTDNVVPMCGFPHHQLDQYTAKLVRARRRVAVCDQVEDPRKATGLVRREIVRIVTPGTMNDPAHLDSKANVWMAAIATAHGRTGAAFLDATTGEFLAWESPPDDPRPWQSLAERLTGFAPKEIVCAEDLRWDDGLRERLERDAVLTALDPGAFAPSAAAASLARSFGVAALDGFGLRDRPAAVTAAAALLEHVRDTQRCEMQHIDGIRFHEPAAFLLLDPATRRNLELERSVRDAGRQGTLLDAVDRTVTPGGGRLLRRWLLAPLLDPEAIRERHAAVDELVSRADVRDLLRERLERVLDVERLLARTVSGTAHARDLLGLKESLSRVPDVILALADVSAGLVRATVDGLDPCDDVARRIGKALADDPPASLRDGGVIRDGFDAELDELRAIRRDGRGFLGGLEARERAATGIGSLKVRFNKVFGYYIEVTKPNLHLVPERYLRKQTIANGERFITPELKEAESKILQAQERMEELELDLFRKLREEVAGHAQRLKVVARATARLDVLAAFAELAVRRGYCRPVVDGGRRLLIRGGRHPVVEQSLGEGRFVPNDADLAAAAGAIAVLTGPNMGGKSTYLRQVALIVLLAQAGCYVPAESAQVGIVDRIFCRVGASDSLADGQSTFMVEMSETANILHHATPRSLLLLDEIGRGTSTFDGLSIAWAVVEHLDAIPGGAPRTLFATHYHELTELALELGSVVNLRMSVREDGDGVVFLHRVEKGASDRSYGIHVARLAGVPAAVVARAQEILGNIEKDEFGRDGLPRRARGARPRNRAQPSLFDAAPPAAPAVRAEPHGILDELRRQDPDRLRPLEALNLLAAWRRKLSDTDPGSA